jgi:NADPH-dependent curcumin reductase CurA
MPIAPSAPRENRRILLKQRPIGLPTLQDFELEAVPVPAPRDGEVLVRNLFMSVDPYMRGRMTDRRSYAAPFQIGQPLEGGAIGEVVSSRTPAFATGDYVESNLGWREWFVAAPAELRKRDLSIAPLPAWLGAMGMPGMTAWVGLLKVAELKDGERVFVSAAAGAVGSVACQIAKLKGCYVVGSAGSTLKCDYLTHDLRIDRAINYKSCGNLGDALGTAFPEGIDVYFDNVGGGHLEAALGHMRFNGRIACCGMIDLYNATAPTPGPGNLGNIIGRCLTMRGFLLPAFRALEPEFLRDMAGWVAADQITWRETIVTGIENAPAAFIGLFTGDNIGKMLVQLAPLSQGKDS